MGEIADAIIEGEICQECCLPLPNVTGYPTTCNSCKNWTPRKSKRKHKVKCNHCDRFVSQIGMNQHIKEKHPEVFGVAKESVR